MTKKELEKEINTSIKMNRCKDCHYWKRNPQTWKYALFPDYGDCSCNSFIMMGDWHIEYDKLSNDTLIYEGTESWAEFQTGKNFGCIHFKERNNYGKIYR